MTPEDIAGVISRLCPTFVYTPDNKGGNLFAGEPPKGVVPCAAVSLSDLGKRYLALGGEAMASYEVYDADIRVQSGDDAEACYALGSRVMESVMGFRGLVESGDSVALCELRAPLSLKRAADGVYTAAFSVRFTAFGGG